MCRCAIPELTTQNNSLLLKKLNQEQVLEEKRSLSEVSQQPKTAIESIPASQAPKVTLPFEDRRKLSRAIQQQKALIFVAHCQQECDKIHPLVNDAKYRAVRSALLSRSRAAPKPKPSPPATFVPFVPIVKPTVTRCVCLSCQSNSISGQALVKFTWTGKARQVELRFAVDGWNTPHPMVYSQLSGVWELGFALPTLSRAQFKFVVDGEWQTHPSFATCQDASGNTNNTIIPLCVEFPDTASSVCVCSQADGWANQKPLERCAVRGTQLTTLVLPGNWTGPFEFKFIVNGAWVLSSSHDSIKNGPFENNMVSL
eukprot:c5310_g1_i1.p1 GENE.c5310_g1_i1~~c5310_g1_i1.p1  ORF type:complete len:330 (+),score=70.64 c5310_g1_i1:53-991(+)